MRAFPGPVPFLALLFAAPFTLGCAGDRQQERVPPPASSPETADRQPSPPVEVKGAVAAGDEEAGAQVWTNSIGISFRRVPPGEFVMEVVDPDQDQDTEDGAPPGGRYRTRAHYLEKQVRITNPFYISELEVTDVAFRQLVGRGADGANRDWRVAEHTDKPAASVTWEDAAEFCRKLSDLPEEKAAGRRYRLPTEAEWVRAKETAKERFSWYEDLMAPLHWQVRELCSNCYDP
jgi:formylglycine-generating enzyme required for sulfatase activity